MSTADGARSRARSRPRAGPSWATSTLSPFDDSAPAELDALRTHLRHCSGSRGRWFGLRCAADTAHDFVASRFVTTLAVAGVAIVAAALWL